MRINIYLIRVSQFLCQFYLVVRHKPGKEYIILDMLNRLTNANNTINNNEYFELNSLFAYHTILIEINPDLVKDILDEYAVDS